MHITIAQGLVVWGGGVTNQETTLRCSFALEDSVIRNSKGGADDELLDFDSLVMILPSYLLLLKSVSFGVLGT